MSATLAWMDGWYDPGACLLRYPSRVHGPAPSERVGVHLVRESAWYAVALLERGGPGDAERAEATIHAVLAQQVDEPGGVAHGTWRRTPEEPAWSSLQRPLREWVDYDPNWREFLGCTLVVALARHAARLSPACVAAMEAALRRAAEGSLARGVDPAYSNIALMSAFLLDWTGDRFGRGDWREAGHALGRSVDADHATCGVFREYGSPTYYGIDLLALGLWRDLACEPWLRAAGARLERLLWEDLARFWHADLANLCGPYTRAYGMDCGAYVSGLGLCLAVAYPRRPAPLPPLSDAMAHAHDRCMLPLLELLPPRIPGSAARHFEAFQGERHVVQPVQCEPFARTASAWLAPGAMLGGEDASGHHVHHQQHPATAHWLERTSDGPRVGWLRLRTSAPVRAHATAGRLEIALETGTPWLRDAEVPVRFSLQAAATPELRGATLALAAGERRLRLETAGLGERLSAIPPASGQGIHELVATLPPGPKPERLHYVLSLG